MQNTLFLAASLITAQAFAGFLPKQHKLLNDQEGIGFSIEEMQEYQLQLDEWNTWLSGLEADDQAVNLNVFSSFHQKSTKFPGGLLGADMEMNEVALFYIEENMDSPYRWEIVSPRPVETEEGIDYISHVFEVVSTEYR
jgi:hypothetical protein